MFNSVFKEDVIANSITFTADPGLGGRSQGIKPELPHNFVSIVSLDGPNGNPVAPGAGTYNIYFKDQVKGGFKSIPDNGALDATKTGGSSMADGLELSASFSGNPIEVKVVPAGITVATHYQVTVKQNLS